ncbi:MmgE/PrpD family protein [Pararhodonellum marinum]|uniref:MmgE/PrpD family protein n=1 Tax=Pararhodonellum marinum TaxID=2755358 RepID=UPI00188E4226|nr:MmgE/PrpD family protein [Pararhodonellum marinum]
MENITDQFVDYLYEKSYAIPDLKTAHQAKRCLLDYLSVVYAGKGLLGNKAIKLISQFPNVDSGSPIIGFGMNKSPDSAAFLNGFVSHVAELDDGINSGIVHPGTPVISSLLAIAKSRNISGEHVLKGIIAGYEATICLANSVQPFHKKKGYHATGTIGAVGAAVGLAVMTGSSKEILKNSISASIISAGGSLKAIEDASQLKPYNVGNAARAGLTAFLIAEAGIEGPDNALGGSRGFFEMKAGSYDLEKLIPSHGNYAIHDIYIKPYAACRYCHPAIEAAIDLSIKQDLQNVEIQKVTVRTYDLAVHTHDHILVPNVSSAKMSIPYSVATSIYNKKAGINEFSEKFIHDEAIKVLTQKVIVIADPEYSQAFPEKSIAALEIELNSGKIYSNLVEFPKGEPENPLSDHELTQKFVDLSNFAGCQKDKIEKTIDAIWSIESNIDRLYFLLN